MVTFSQCLDCKNYIGKSEKGKHICKAFPNNIPEEIFWNEKIHTENIEGDNGITYDGLNDPPKMVHRSSYCKIMERVI